MAVAAVCPDQRRLQSCHRTWGEGVLIAVLCLLTVLPVRQLCAFPSSLSDCQTPTGWNCSGFDEQDTDLFLCDTNTCKYDGECLRIGDSVTCICNFKCSSDYVPVCGSNGESYENECLLRKEACKLQTEVLVVSEGSCPIDAGSGSGDDAGGEGSAETSQRETSTCDICQFGAECDEDAEDVWCVCNIDCAYTNFNPVCASDGLSYDNPCQVKEASCQKQEKIEVRHLGHCQKEANARGLSIPCPERYNNYCIHGDCQYPNSLSPPTCSCHSGFSGPQCDTKEYNVMYVVPGSGKVRYVLIASIIGALQVAIICLVVLCITRSTRRKRRRRGLAMQPTPLNQWEEGVKETPPVTPAAPTPGQDPLVGQFSGGGGEVDESHGPPRVALHLWYTTPMKTGA
ncbi:tomoregulin-2 isoform X1 [Alosa alosa]|uniref:tomoregulin-2 isoform X1 n=1 Tax=Alosa alosa TaxID=278164 RepID=UPI00201537E8|nr:tomoregulin-2 isoform X1 [Alosa alosa]